MIIKLLLLITGFVLGYLFKKDVCQPDEVADACEHDNTACISEIQVGHAVPFLFGRDEVVYCKPTAKLLTLNGRDIYFHA